MPASLTWGPDICQEDVLFFPTEMGVDENVFQFQSPPMLPDDTTLCVDNVCFLTWHGLHK